MTKVEVLRPSNRPESEEHMKFGGNFFLILNFAVKLIRLFFEVFGDDEDKDIAVESEARSKAESSDAC